MTKKKFKKSCIENDSEEFMIKSFQLLSDTYLIIVKSNVKFHLRGFIQISVVQGAFYICGCTLLPQSETLYVYSSETTGMHSLESINQEHYIEENAYLERDNILIVQCLTSKPLEIQNVKEINLSCLKASNAQTNKPLTLEPIKKLLQNDTNQGLIKKMLLTSYNPKLALFNLLMLKNPKSFCSDPFIIPKSIPSILYSIHNESPINSLIVLGKSEEELSLDSDIQVIEPMTSDDSSIKILDSPCNLDISKEHDMDQNEFENFITGHLFNEPKCFDQIEQLLYSNGANCCSKILICGRQGVGKSTLAKYIANRIITKLKNQSDPQPSRGVIWMECDVGQPEFHPAGIISLVHIPYNKYTLSPSWLEPSPFLSTDDTYKIIESQYFGYNTPSHDPITYLKIINNLYQVYFNKYAQDYILLINTNGWFKGMGLYLLGEIITIINPMIVVHLMREFNAGESVKPLVDTNLLEFVREDPSFKTFHNSNHLFLAKDHSNNTSVEEMHTFDYIIEKRSWISQKVNSTKRSLKQCASTSRTLMLMTYFADILVHPQSTQHTTKQKECVFYAGCLLPCKPHAISFGQIEEISFLCTADFPVKMLACEKIENFAISSIIGKLVALCHLPTNQPSKPAQNSGLKMSTQINLQHTCLGLGVVRNVDFKARILYVLSPLPVTIVPKVGYLIKGGIELPKEFLEIYLGQRMVTYKANPLQEDNLDGTNVDHLFDFLSHPVKTKRNDPKIGKRLRKLRKMKSDA